VNETKIGIKSSVERRLMKKLLLTCILIVSIMFITGCIGEEKTDTETPTSSQISHESNTQVPDLIMQPSDVPGLTLTDYYFIAVSKSAAFDLNNIDTPQSYQNAQYQNVLPLGMRNAGQQSKWEDESGRRVEVVLTKFDSNSGFEVLSEGWDEQRDEYNDQINQHPQEFKESGLSVMGNPNIGDASYYVSLPSGQDVETIVLNFIYKNYMVCIEVNDEKDKSAKEAIRIAKIVKNRLD